MTLFANWGWTQQQMYSIPRLNEDTNHQVGGKPEKLTSISKCNYLTAKNWRQNVIILLLRGFAQNTLYSNSDAVGENGRGQSENCIWDVTILKKSIGGRSTSRISKGQLCVSKGKLVKVIGQVIVTSVTTTCWIVPLLSINTLSSLLRNFFTCSNN